MNVGFDLGIVGFWLIWVGLVWFGLVWFGSKYDLNCERKCVGFYWIRLKVEFKVGFWIDLGLGWAWVWICVGLGPNLSLDSEGYSLGFNSFEFVFGIDVYGFWMGMTIDLRWNSLIGVKQKHIVYFFLQWSIYTLFIWLIMWWIRVSFVRQLKRLDEMINMVSKLGKRLGSDLVVVETYWKLYIF